MNNQYLICALIGYISGTLPSAMIVYKLLSGKDIRKSGSGNIGAMNSYDLTGKKWVGFVVFLMDAGKGALAVLLAKSISFSFWPIALAALFVVVGHNFNIFLKFHGGRGLAAAVGAAAMLNPAVIILWAFIWIITYKIIDKNVHIDNAFATFFTPVILFLMPDTIINILNTTNIDNMLHYKFLVVVICFVIFIRHIKPLVELRKNRK